MGYSNFKKIQQVTERFGLDQLTAPFLGGIIALFINNFLNKTNE